MSILLELANKFKFTKNKLDKLKEKYREFRYTTFGELEFILDNHAPIPSARPRMGKFGNFYVPHAAKKRKLIRKILDKQLPDKFQTIETEIYISIKYYFPMKSNFNQIDQILAELGLIRPIMKPDVDNLDKTYFDALNEYVWKDDSQIVYSLSRKYFSFNPRVEIHIKYSHNNYLKILGK